MGEQYLYQKFPFLSQKKRSSLKYIFGRLLLFTTYYYLSNAFESGSFAYSSFQE